MEKEPKMGGKPTPKEEKAKSLVKRSPKTPTQQANAALLGLEAGRRWQIITPNKSGTYLSLTTLCVKLLCKN